MLAAGPDLRSARTRVRSLYPFIGRVLGLVVLAVLMARPAVARADEDPLEKLRPTTGQAVAPAVTALTLEAKRARATIEGAQTGTDVASESEDIDALLQVYGHMVDGAIDRTFGRSRLRQLRERLVLLTEDIWADQEGISADTDEVQLLEATWQRHRAHWISLRGTLSEDPMFAELGPQVDGGLATIEEVLGPLPEITQARVAQQQELFDRSEQAQSLLDRIDRQLAGLHPWSRSTTQPPMYSAAFWRASLATPAAEPAPRQSYQALASRLTPTLATHVALFIILMLVVRALRPATPRGDRPLVLFEHPVAVAALLSTTFVASEYSSAPSPVSAAIIVVFSVSAAFTARGALAHRHARAGAIVLSLVYPALLLCDLLGVPTPVMRGLVVVASIGLGATVVAATRSAGPWLMHAGRWLALALLAVAVTEFLGFVDLARFLLVGLFNTALTVLISIAVLTFLRRLSDTIAVRPEAPAAQPQWRQVLGVLGSRIGRAAEVVVVLAALLVMLRDWEIMSTPRETIRELLGTEFVLIGIEISAARVLGAAFTVYVAFQVAKVLEIVLEMALFRSGSWDDGLASSIRTLTRYTTVAVGALIALGVLGLDGSTLTLVAGALGVGVGFGLQNIVNDFVSGLLLLFERPIRKGDSLVIEGTWGRVKHIGLRSTVITLVDESELVVPNGHLTSEKIRNWTLSSHAARIFCPVGVAYGSDLQRVALALHEVAERSEDVLKIPAPEVLFLEFGESTLNFELRVWAKSVQQRFQIRSRILCAIDARFREEQIEIAFPQRDLHIRSIVGGPMTEAIVPAPKEP